MRDSLPSAFLAVGAALLLLGCGSEKTTAPEPPPPVDSVPPVMLHLIGPPEAVTPGSLFEIRFRARDSVGIKSATVTVRGAFTDSLSGDFEDVPQELEAYAHLYAPNGTPLDQSAIVRVTVFDEAGNAAYGETQVWFIDRRPPQASLSLGGLHFDDGTIRTGETLEIYINAEDNHRLKYIGYEGGGLRDSVPSNDVGDSHVFRLSVPESWAANRPLLKPFARDSSGNLSSDSNVLARHVPVYNWVSRDITTWLLPSDENAPVLWDAKRHSVYRLRHDVNESSRIDGVDISSGAFLPAVTLPRSPQDFTFSPTGDSLVVIFSSYYDATLGIVDLLSGNRATSIYPLQYGFPLTNPRLPYAGHAAGGRFFVSLMAGQHGARLLDVDFRTGNHVIRTDIDGGAEIPYYTTFVQLPDSRVVIGSSFVPYPPDYRLLYSPIANNFTPTFRLRSVSSRNYSSSPSGRFMMANTVYGAALDSITTVATQDWTSGMMALSPDGQFVYLSTLYGYQKVRLSDGAVLEQVRLPNQPLYLFALADGTKLIAVTESSVRVIDLR